MTKHDLIDHLATETGLAKASVDDVLKSLGDLAKTYLKRGGEIPLPGIGRLSARQRAGRTGHNPKTGEPVAIPARCVAAFQASKTLKDALN